MVIVGNLTPYKDLPAIIDAFTTHTRRARLLVAGPCRTPSLAEHLAAQERAGGGRIRLHLDRIPPEHVRTLYRAASAVLCPYRAESERAFFRHVLYPASGSTALASGTAVIAPDLSAIAEMTQGRRAWLYPAPTGAGPLLAAAESILPLCAALDSAPADASRQWRVITTTYERIFHQLAATPSTPRAEQPAVVGRPAHRLHRPAH